MTTWDDVLTMPHVVGGPIGTEALDRNPFGTTTGSRPTDVRRTSVGRHDAERESETETERRPTSSLSASQRAAAIRELNELDAATRTILTLRPGWAPLDVRDALAGDPRPWATVVAAAVAAAMNLEVGHPNAIRTTSAGLRSSTATPIPPTVQERLAEVRALDAEGAS